MTNSATTRRSRVATVVLLVLALLLAAATAYILFDPVSPSNFESTTGVSWDDFSVANPEAADYLSREGRLLAVGWLGLTLLVAATVWGPLRRGEGWAKRTLWLFPTTVVGAALVFLVSGDTALGGMYLVVGVITAVCLAMAGRSDG